MPAIDAPDDDESRPTTALHRDDILGLVAHARDTYTEAVAPIVMIVDRPQALAPNTQRAIATRMMQPIELASMGYAPLEVLPPRKSAKGTRPISRRRASGVVVEAPKPSPHLWLWLACCVGAAIAMVALAP